MSVYLPLISNLSSSYESLRCLYLSRLSSQLNFCQDFDFYEEFCQAEQFQKWMFWSQKRSFSTVVQLEVWRSAGNSYMDRLVFDFLDTRKLQFQQLKIVLTLSAPAPKYGQTHSNNLSATICCSNNTVLPLRKVAFIYESIRQIIFFYYFKSPSNRDL